MLYTRTVLKFNVSELFCRCFVLISPMPLNPRKSLVSFGWRFMFVWFLLYITTVTVDYFLLETWFESIGKPFHWLAVQTGNVFFGVSLVGANHFYSDTLLIYIHLFNLSALSIIIATVWNYFTKKDFAETKSFPVLLTSLRYFLALQLFMYGFAKIYKWQFMLPEPNILYTLVGDLHRDILYWTSMGSSRSYTMFMGMVEIVPAILLLFRRTTLAGAFAAVLVMTNVVAVNFGFDITVKLHSSTLLIISCVLLIPGRKRMLALFTGKATEEWKYPVFTISENRKWIGASAKVVAVIIIFAESHYPYWMTGNYNDDVSERPPMHGAYEVITYSSSYGDTLVRNSNPSNRIFVHRHGYLIFQYENGGMNDYPVVIDSTNQTIHLTGYNFGSEFEGIRWKQINDSVFEFRSANIYSTEYWLVKKLDVSKLPLMQEEFTWIDRD